MAEQDEPMMLARAAELSGENVDTLRRAIYDGRLAATRIGEGRRSILLVRLADVEAYIASRPKRAASRVRNNRDNPPEP